MAKPTEHNGQHPSSAGIFKRICTIPIGKLIPSVWFENENRDVAQCKTNSIEARHNAPPGFDKVHVLQIGVIAQDTLCFDENDVGQLIGRELHPFDIPLTESMVRRGADLAFSMCVTAEACERCTNALRFEFRGVGYPANSAMYVKNPARCRLCREEGRQLDTWFRGSYKFTEETSGPDLSLAGG